ncbi:hypothetical protein EW145_g3926 [Phellinidium pouzarii]|uniref:H/ACA ribonucleoprotein complex non-core subunit NAF1 n=1 Tax=Phellinidium pouzarii TaxID=167371 RepID=A0A4S4L5E1_9AGAM|nr:hypothetical protein EW145_g3926 [Phellinidium pouzarii]
MFKVPSSIPQDLLLIQGLISVPDSGSTKVKATYNIKESLESIDSSGASSDSETDSEEVDVVESLLSRPDEAEGTDVKPQSPSPSDSDSESVVGRQKTDEKRRKPSNGAIGDSDDEDEGAVSAAGPILRTKNEIQETSFIAPDIVEVGIHEPMEKVGEILSVIDNVVVVKGLASQTENKASERALDAESLLVFENRRVLGYVHETFGPTHQPLYQVRFSTADAIDKELVTTSRAVFHVPPRSNFVFPGQLRRMKGSDASNVHDEEINEDDIEFSDDEAEAAYKRQRRAQREGYRESSVTSRFSTPTPSQMHDYDLVEDSFYSTSPYDEYGPYDTDALPGPSRPTPLPHLSGNSQKADKICQAGVETLAMNEQEVVVAAVAEKEEEEGVGAKVDVSVAGGVSYGAVGGDRRQPSWTRSSDGDLSEPRNHLTSVSRDNSAGSSIPRPVSPTSMVIARATGQYADGSTFVNKESSPSSSTTTPSMVGDWHRQAYGQHFGGPSQQFYGGQPYDQQGYVQPHINPRFASAFGIDMNFIQGHHYTPYHPAGAQTSYGVQQNTENGNSSHWSQHVPGGNNQSGAANEFAVQMKNELSPQHSRLTKSQRLRARRWANGLYVVWQPRRAPKSSFTPSGGTPAPEDDAEDCSAPASTAGSVRTKQKRVLPSRARRGGPGAGVGSGDIDLNILDLLKRRGENDPLIPSKTVFVLTTDSRFVPSASTSELGLNHYANERYFDRVEVIKAYQEQQDIQIPEFTQMTDEEMVGGRLRARSNEVECADLSDAAYEKRHRKHEMLEKRQRLREKEKLQHEHYKLKERIDQLRNIDYNAFLSLPAEAFGEISIPVDFESVIAMGASASSAAALNEGERRRRLMLEVATSLEDRYRTLLPPDRKVPEKDKYPDRMASGSVEPGIADEDDDAAVPESQLAESVVPNRSKPLKVKLKLRPPTAPTSPSPLSAPLRSSRRRRGQSVDQDFSLLPPDIVPANDCITVTASHRVSTPRTRSKTSTRLPSPPPNQIYSIDHDAAIIDTFPSSNHISPNHPAPNYVPSSYRNPELSVPSQHRPNLPVGTYPEHVYTALSYSNLNYGFPHQTVPHIELQLHHLSPEDFEMPQRKKFRIAHSSADHTTPPVEYVVMEDDIDDMPAFSPVLPGYFMQADSPVPLELPAPIQHDSGISQYERPSQPESSVPPPVQRESGAPPTEYERTGSSIEGEYLPPAGQQSTAPPQWRATPTSSRRRESTAPVLSTASASPSVGSLQAYSLPTGPGRRRPPPCILAVSKYNVAPGRKTGRSVKAFGVDVPPFVENEFEFELPYGLIEEVEELRSGPVDYYNTEDAESDHAYWLLNGDQHVNGSLQENGSALGLEGMVDTSLH